MPKFKKGDRFKITWGNAVVGGVVNELLIPGVEGIYRVTLDSECPKEYSYPPTKHVSLLEEQMEKL